MKRFRLPLSLALLALAALLVPMTAVAGSMSVSEILTNHSARPMPETFRIGVQVQNLKKDKMTSQHFLWIMGKREPDQTSLFIDFEEPEDAKGMRFLFLLSDAGGSPTTRAFGYLPATGVAAPMKVGTRSLNIGGTGLTIEDFRGFVLAKARSAELVTEERVGTFDCYVISLDMGSDVPRKKAWISKNGFLLVRSQDLDVNGRVEREFLVKDFFTTTKGEQWARREEVILPKEATRILVEQIAGIYNIDLPDEVFDPEKFGPCVWRTVGDR